MDGNAWERREVNGRWLPDENHMPLKLKGEKVIKCYYTYGQDDAMLQRRIYWLIEKHKDNIALVHYLRTNQNRRRRRQAASAAGTQAAGRAATPAREEGSSEPSEAVFARLSSPETEPTYASSSDGTFRAAAFGRGTAEASAGLSVREPSVSSDFPAGSISVAAAGASNSGRPLASEDARAWNEAGSRNAEVSSPASEAVVAAQSAQPPTPGVDVAAARSFAPGATASVQPPAREAVAASAQPLASGDAAFAFRPLSGGTSDAAFAFFRRPSGAASDISSFVASTHPSISDDAPDIAHHPDLVPPPFPEGTPDITHRPDLVPPLLPDDAALARYAQLDVFAAPLAPTGLDASRESRSAPLGIGLASLSRDDELPRILAPRSGADDAFGAGLDDVRLSQISLSSIENASRILSGMRIADDPAAPGARELGDLATPSASASTRPATAASSDGFGSLDRASSPRVRRSAEGGTTAADERSFALPRLPPGISDAPRHAGAESPRQRSGYALFDASSGVRSDDLSGIPTVTLSGMLGPLSNPPSGMRENAPSGTADLLLTAPSLTSGEYHSTSGISSQAASAWRFGSIRFPASEDDLPNL